MLFSSVGYVLLPSSAVWANPTGEKVVGGSATFDRKGSTLTVNQKTDRLAVNWQTFSIASGEHTHFNMPSAASIALNRVLGGNPSDIRGTLTGNGTIIVANPFGISTAPGSLIKTGAFVGTTRDINPDEFMRADFSQGFNLHGNSAAPILVEGNITAEKGDVFLIAQKVENRGTISAPNGKAALVGTGQGEQTEVVLYEQGGAGFAVRVAQLDGQAAQGSNHGLPDGEELLNEGEISAAQAELNASGNIYALAIKNSGTIRAKAVVANVDGTVRLDGGMGDVMNTGKIIAQNAGNEATAAGGKIGIVGQNVTASPESIITAAGGAQGGDGGKVKIDSADTTIVQGKVDVTAPSAAAKGGKVELLGNRVGLLDGAKVDASGGAGGGTVLAGGDYLGGRTPSANLKDLAKQEAEPVKNAQATVMADTAEIKADATVNGDGGKIILWSEDYTGFYGNLFARGGREGGDGGFIETSSKNNLQALGSVNASGPSGRAGMWLLDPLNVSIITGGTGTLSGGVFTPTLSDSTIAPTTIVGALDTGAGTDVTITTGSTGVEDGNITVVNAITTAASNNRSLTLQAANNIQVNAAIDLSSNTGAASVNLLADSDLGVANGFGTITTTAAVTAGSTGTVTLQGAGAIGLGAVVTAQDVIFQPSQVNGSIGVNDATGKTQIASSALLANLVATGTVTIGRNDGTGTISIGSGGALNLSGESYNLALRGAASDVVFNFSGATTLTLKNNGSLTVNLGTGNLLSPGSATTDLTIGGTGSLILTSVGQVGSADSTAPFNTSILNLSGTSTSSINIRDASGLTVNGALNSNGNNITLDADGGAFANTAGSTINAGTGVVTVTANTIDIGDIITGNGGINLLPNAAATTIALNDAAGTFSLSAAEMVLLESSGTVTIGRSNSSGALNIGSSGTLDLSAENFNLTLLKASGTTTFNFGAGNTLTLANDKIMTFNVGTGTVLNGASGNTTDITIGGNGTITFASSGAVGGNGTTQRLKTSVANYGTSVTTGNVSLTSTRVAGVNLAGTFNVGANNLSFDSPGPVTQDAAITAGGLELKGAGPYTLLNTANNITTLAGNVTGGAVSYVDADAFTVGTVNTAGFTASGGALSLTSQSGTITISQAITASGGALAVQTSGAGAIAVNAAVTASGGNASFQTANGNITTTQAITASGGTLAMQTSGGGITTGNTITASGGNVSLQTSGTGAIAVNGAINSTKGTLTFQAQNATITVGAAVTSSGGDLTILTSNGAVTINNAISAPDRSVNITAGGSNQITANSSINAADGVVTLTANDLVLASTITGNGGINIVPAAGTTLSIGGAGATFNLSSGEMANFLSTGVLTFGSSSSRLGAITIGQGGATSLAASSYSLSLFGGSGGGGLTFNNTLTLGNNRGFTLDLGTGNLVSAAGSGVDLAIGGSGVLAISAAGQVGQGGNGAFVTQVSRLNGATVSGALALDNSNQNLDVTGAIQAGANNVTLTTGTGRLSNSAAINSTGTILLTTDNPNLSAAIGGTGATVTLRQQTSGQQILLGTGAALFTLSPAALANITAAILNIGNPVSGSNGGITVTADTTVNNVQNLNLTSGAGISVTGGSLTGQTMTLDAGSGNAGSFVSTRAVTASGTLTIKANTVNLGTTVTAGSGGINLQPDVAATTVGLNDAAGTLNLSEAELQLLTTSGTVTVGSGTSTGAFTLGSLGGINLSGRTYDLTIQKASGATTFNFGAAQTLTLADNKTLTFNVGTGTINGSSANTTDITIGGATGGMTITTSGAVGATQRLKTAVSQYNASTINGNAFLTELNDLGISGAFSVGANNLSISAGGAVTQGAAATITASGLELLGAGSFDLLTANNAITTLAGNASGNIKFLDNTGYAIGTVNTAGLTSGGNITLSSAGAVTQGAGGAITGNGLELLGAGSFDLLTVNNAITTLAGNASGNIKFLDNTGYAIGTVNTVGLTSAGNITLQSTGGVTQSQLLAATGLELLGAGGAFTLTDSGNAITTLAGNTGSVAFLDQTGGTPFLIGTVNTVGLTTTGNTTLDTGTSTGTVTQSQKIAASGLELKGAGAYTLGNTANDVTTLAGNTTGAVSYTDNNGFTVGTVNTAGLTTAGAASITLTTTTGATGTFANTASITAGTTGSVTVTANQAAIGATITGNGGINLVPDANTTTLGLNDAAGTLNFSEAELQFLSSTGTVTLGSAGSSGALTVGSLGSINLSGTTYDLTVRKASGATSFNFGAAQTLTLANNKTLTFNVGTGTINGSSANTADITIGGTTGGMTITASGAVGATQRLKTAVSQYNASTISGNAFLTELNDLVIAGAFTVGANNLSLRAGGAVTQTAIVTASNLELLGAGSFSMGTLSNPIGTLAGNVTGDVDFRDNSGISVGTVNTVGLTSTAGNIILRSTGAISQTATGAIVANAAGKGLAIFSDATPTLTSTGNDVKVLAVASSDGSGSLPALTYSQVNGFEVGQVGTLAGITSLGPVNLTSSAGNISVTKAIQAGDPLGVLLPAAVTLTSGGGAISVDASLTATGAVNLTTSAAGAAGNISASKAIQAGATSTITANGAGATFSNTETGTVEVTAGDLTVTSGKIALLGNLKSSAGTIFLQPNANSVNLGLNTVTGEFDLSTAELLGLISGAVQLGRSTGTGAITFGGAGAFDISATSYDLTLRGTSSAISFINGITMGNARTLTLAGGGAITSPGSGTDITIGDGFNSGTLVISSATTVGAASPSQLVTAVDRLGASTVTGNVFLNNTRALIVAGAVNIGGNLNLITGGSLSQESTGAITVAGSSTIAVPAGTDILLADAANNLGALTLTGTGGTTFRDLELRNINADADVPTLNATRNVAFLFDNAGIVLPQLTLSGTLDVSAGGGTITQSGPLNITGNATFTGTGFGITLVNPSNVFAANVSLNTTGLQNASLLDSSALVLGDSDVSGLLQLTSGGSITQSTGTTLTTGAGLTTSFTAANSDLLLNQAGNDIGGQVAFTGIKTNIRDVNILSASTLAQVPILEGLTNLRDLTLNYSGVTSFEAPILQAFASLRNISFTAQGPMTQKTGGISNSGTASFTVTGAGNDITLDDALNNFGGPVSLSTNNGDASLRESNALEVGTMNLGTGALTLNVTSGLVTDSGVITASSLDITSVGGVTLDVGHQVGTLEAVITGAGQGISFANNGTDLALNPITAGAGGNILVSTTGSADISVNGLLTASGTGNILVTTTQNDSNITLNANIVTAAGNLTLQAAGDLAGSVALSPTGTGKITLFADGDLSYAGDPALSGGKLDLTGMTIRGDGVAGVTELRGAQITGVGGKVLGTGLVIVAPSYSKGGPDTAPTVETDPLPYGFGINTGGTGDFNLSSNILQQILTTGTVQAGTGLYSGQVTLGSISLAGSKFQSFEILTSAGGYIAPGTLTANPAATPPYFGGVYTAGDAGIYTPGIDVTLNSAAILPINETIPSTLTIDTTGGGVVSTGADIILNRRVEGGVSTSASSALTGSLILIAGSASDVQVNATIGPSIPLAKVQISGQDIEVGRITSRINVIGAGGVISLQAGRNLTTGGSLDANGITRVSGVGVTGGEVVLEAANEMNINGTVSANGGLGVASLASEFGGGGAGSISLLPVSGSSSLQITVNGALQTVGGQSSNKILPRGADGVVKIRGRDIGIAYDQIGQYLMEFDIASTRNLIVAGTPNFTDPTKSSGTVNFFMNQVAGSFENNPTTRGELNLYYGTSGTDGQFFMNAGSAISMLGGNLSVICGDALGTGGLTLGQVYTGRDGVRSGNITLDSKGGVTDAFVLNTTAGNPVAITSGTEALTYLQYGLSGGNIQINASAVTLGDISTQGSASLATATVPATGGSGGGITVTAPKITLQGALNTAGGAGQGATGVYTVGGGGGSIQLTGNVVLNSGDSAISSIQLQTAGGSGTKVGSGGKVAITGSVTGTPANSNSLDLVTGSGNVVLGTTFADTITLATLATGSGTSGSAQGSVDILGKLNIETLTTSARAYSISIQGKGSKIANQVNFQNTGTVSLGVQDDVPDLNNPTVLFTGGFNALTGPSLVQLAGYIASGSGTGASMLMDTAVLTQNTFLNSNGNNIQIGVLDGTVAGGQSLSFLAGVGSGTVQLFTTGGSVKLNDITVAGGASSFSTTTVVFTDTVQAISLSTGANSQATFSGNVTLSGNLNLQGATTLTSVDENVPLTLQAADGTIAGALQLTKDGGNSVEIETAGALNATGGVSGAVNLILAGNGAKTFSGAVAIGSSEGVSLSISGGDTVFNGTLVTENGVLSSSEMSFFGNVTLDRAQTGLDTTFSQKVTLGNGMNFLAAGGGKVTMADDLQLVGGATLTGASEYQMDGLVQGGDLVLGSTGKTTFGNTVNLSGISQTASADVEFGAAVDLSAGAVFGGKVILADNVFTAGTTVRFAGLQLNGTTTELAGNASYEVLGAVNGPATLALSGTKDRVFYSTIGTSTAGIGGIQETGGGAVDLRGNVFTAGGSAFAGLVRLRDMAFSSGGVTSFGNVVLGGAGATLQGGGAISVAKLDGTVAGAQTLNLAGDGLKSFSGKVGDATVLKGIQQSGNTVAFAGDVKTLGNSSFNGQVELSGMTFAGNQAGSKTSFNQTVTFLGGSVEFGGAGNFVFGSSLVAGLNTALTMNGTSSAQTFTLQGDLGGNFTSLEQKGAGQLLVGSSAQSSVQMDVGGAVNIANLSTLGSLLVDTSAAGGSQEYGNIALGGNLTAEAGGGTVAYNKVNGRGDLTTTADVITVTPTTVRNKGMFYAIKNGGGSIAVGGSGPGKFMNATSLSGVHSTGGLQIQTESGNIGANDFSVTTGLSLMASGGGIQLSEVSASSGLSLEAMNDVNFAGAVTTSALNRLWADQGVVGIQNLKTSALGNVRLGAGDLDYSPTSRLNINGPVEVSDGYVFLAPKGGMVNGSGLANPYAGSSSVTLVTSDLFGTQLQTILQPGANLIRGTSGAVPGEPGVNIYYENFNNLLPYSFQFATGTGQPYILATQNAVPAVMLPASLVTSGAFAAQVRFSKDELEMMTPEERAAYESGLRRQAARVLLQRESGQSEEIGLPTEGEIPQAGVKAPQSPAPTAQVFLQGQPLAVKSERGDATRILRSGKVRSVAMDAKQILEQERMEAEVGMISVPVAQSR